MNQELSQWPPARGTIDSEQWWQALSKGVLLIWRCQCSETWIYSRARCPRCGESTARLERSSGRGKIVAVSVIHRRRGDAQEDRPVLAVVETTEGARLLSQVESKAGQTPRANDPVEIIFGPELPKFRVAR